MATVVHHIKGRHYLYNHFRDHRGKVATIYMYPVDKTGKYKMAPEHGGGRQ